MERRKRWKWEEEKEEVWNLCERKKKCRISFAHSDFAYFWPSFIGSMQEDEKGKKDAKVIR